MSTEDLRTRKKAELEMRWLERELLYHSYLYYCLDAPVITDYEYDVKFRRLEVLEEKFSDMASNDSITSKVGGGFVPGVDY
jgi:DNA ligase (NAD+)